jgi:hypothetical protein
MGATATDDSDLSSRQGKLILALVCLAAFLDVIDTTIVNIALPSIREHIPPHGGLLPAGTSAAPCGAGWLTHSSTP